MFDLTGKRVWVAGHRGLVGSALVRRLEAEPIGELVVATRSEVDLRRQDETERFVRRTRPQVLFLSAARVGGIQANRSAQAEFLYENLMIGANAIKASQAAGVEKLVAFGSACVYPRGAPQPIREESLLTGRLEPTNEGYAVAKITQLQLARMLRRQYGFNAISLMPTNLYGPNDNFDLETGHVLAALLRKLHEAKISGADKIEIWGTGTPKREFLHADDLADAAIFCLRHFEGEDHLNVGSGEEVAIADLARVISSVIGWDGEFFFNTEMPDGMPRKLLDSSKLAGMGWRPRVQLRQGIEDTYRWFLANEGS